MVVVGSLLTTTGEKTYSVTSAKQIYVYEDKKQKKKEEQGKKARRWQGDLLSEWENKDQS